MPRPRPKSRPARWAEAADRAVSALQELQEIQEEYNDWRDNLPENLDGSMLAEKLEAVCELELEEAERILQEAAEADLPLGFGRD